jgi:hypothetical protein
MRDQGSLVAHETGQVTSYAIESAQERGTLFVRPGEQVYEGQVVGVYNKAGDLKVNVCKQKALTNMRAANKEVKTALDEARVMSLDEALEYISEDELVEVRPGWGEGGGRTAGSLRAASRAPRRLPTPQRGAAATSITSPTPAAPPPRR